MNASTMERTPGGLRAWYDAPELPSVAIAGGGALEFRWADAGAATVVKQATVDGGVVVTLQRPAEGHELLEVTSGRSVRRVAMAFRASPKALTATITETARANPLQAEALLAALPPSDWPWGCVGLARTVALDERVAAYTRCADGAASRGFVSEAINRRIAALYWATILRRHAEAAALVVSIEGELEAFPDARLSSQFHYQYGVFLAALGDLHRAERVFGLAIDEASRAGRPDEVALARGYLAVVVSEAGRHADATVIARGLESPPATLSRSDQLALRSNVTWVALRALASAPTPGLIPPLRQSLEQLAADLEAEGQAVDASSVWSNLAFLEVLDQHPARAREVIGRARRLLRGTSTLQSLFLDWLEGRVALQQGDTNAAVKSFEALAKNAEAAGPQAFTDASWRASLGLAEAHLRAGRMTKATQALGDARRALSSQARVFAELSERVVFLEDRRHALAEAVEAFARAGATGLAFTLADDGQAWLARSLEFDRRVRLAQLGVEARAAFDREEEAYARERERVLSDEAPSLASVEALGAWRAARAKAMSALRARATALAARLDRDAPRQPAVSFEASRLAGDEALLELFRAGRQTRAFLVRRSGPVATAADALELLSAERLAGVRHVYVVDGGAGLRPGHELREVLARVSLSFLPSASWLAQPPTVSKGGALVIGDPRLDLPSARAEARAVATLLRASALEPVVLEGDAATLEAVARQWHDISVLHFAGHGRLAPDAPWEARLDLARGQSLDLEFLLSRRPRSSLVVLSGCETGASTLAPADAIGLAEGFLASGANQVLATTEKVADDGAATFVERFYRLGGVTKPADAFRAAALEAEAAGDEGWRSWKFFGRR